MAETETSDSRDRDETETLTIFLEMRPRRDAGTSRDRDVETETTTLPVLNPVVVGYTWPACQYWFIITVLPASCCDTYRSGLSTNE